MKYILRTIIERQSSNYFLLRVNLKIKIIINRQCLLLMLQLIKIWYRAMRWELLLLSNWTFSEFDSQITEFEQNSIFRIRLSPNQARNSTLKCKQQIIFSSFGTSLTTIGQHEFLYFLYILHLFIGMMCFLCRISDVDRNYFSSMLHCDFNLLYYFFLHCGTSPIVKIKYHCIFINYFYLCMRLPYAVGRKMIEIKKINISVLKNPF